MLAPTPEAKETEAPAPAAAKAATEKPAPASDPVTSTEETAEGAERGADGKFRAKEPEDSPGVAKRIGRLLQTQRDIERERDDLKAQLAKPGSQPAAAGATQPRETAQPAAGKPDPGKFDTYEAYVEALTTWSAKSIIDSHEAQRATAEAARKNAEAWDAGKAALVAEHADYDEVIAGAAAMPISRVMHDAIGTVGPRLAYYFATHPDETARIEKLAPMEALFEIGAIKAGFAQPAAAATSVKPAAAAAPKALPRPPANVGGSHAPNGGVDLNDPKLDQVTFNREFKKRLAADRS